MRRPDHELRIEEARLWDELHDLIDTLPPDRGTLPEASAEADRWIDKTGPAHYAEHLPRLRAWVEEVTAG